MCFPVPGSLISVSRVWRLRARLRSVFFTECGGVLPPSGTPDGRRPVPVPGFNPPSCCFTSSGAVTATECIRSAGF